LCTIVIVRHPGLLRAIFPNARGFLRRPRRRRVSIIIINIVFVQSWEGKCLEEKGC